MTDQERKPINKILILILRAGFFNVKDFATQLQISDSMVYQTLNKHNKISRYMATFWAFYLNVHPSELAEITKGSWDFTISYNYLKQEGRNAK